MTIPEIEQTLEEARSAVLKYKKLRDKASEYERRLIDGRSVRYDNNGSTHERNGNSTEYGLCTAADYRAEADRAAKAFLEPYYIEACRLIYLVHNDKQREVLNKYYLCGKNFGEIAYKIKISYRHVTRLHKAALKKISENT